MTKSGVFLQSQEKLARDVNDYLFKKSKRDKFAKEVSRMVREMKL
jgi:hypothetical protein